MTTKLATLYVIATPIGHLADLSPRAQETLKSVQLILAEDTRHSKVLLQHFGIATRLESCHEHNEREKSITLLAQLQAGHDCALISDAGTPVWSDPGAKLITAVLEAGYPVSPIPGPCAAIAALSASGLEGMPFHFYGFLPAQTAAKRKLLEQLQKNLAGTLCFYESPHRLLDSLQLFQALWGDTHILVLAKEISKIHEAILKQPIGEILAWLKADPKRQQGEFVLLLENTPPPQEGMISVETDVLLTHLLAQMKLKEAVALLANLSDLPKNKLYERALILKGESP